MYFRSFIPDSTEEIIIAKPKRQSISLHDISEIAGLAKQPSYNELEVPQKKAEFMYCRPGFDNVPSY